MIPFNEIRFHNSAPQRLRQIYAVLYFMERSQTHTEAIHSALAHFPQVNDIQTIRDKCARQFAGHIGTFAEWHRLGLMYNKLQSILNLDDHDLEIFQEILGAKNQDENDKIEDIQEVSGGIFGNAENNKSVEVAAIAYARRWYVNLGWYVESVESLNCGFDLLCTKDEEILNVEVKGISGNEIKFILTKNEYKEAQKNPNFLLFLVTSANLDSAIHIIIPPKELLSGYSFTPLEYVVQKKNL